MTATLEAIRDRVLTLVAGITPTSLSGTRFLAYRAEGDGLFTTWADENPQAAFRRFDVRDDGTDDGVGETSSQDVELRNATLIIAVSYPLDSRAGAQAGRDRDDCIDADWRAIYRTVGPGAGQANFSGANDCTIISCRKSRERGQACDFLIVTVALTYYLDTSA